MLCCSVLKFLINLPLNLCFVKGSAIDNEARVWADKMHSLQHAWAQANGDGGVVGGIHAVRLAWLPCAHVHSWGSSGHQGTDRIHKQAFWLYTTRAGTTGTQAVNSVSKLLQNHSVCMDIAIKHIKGLLEFFKEFRIPEFENYCTIAKQISQA